MPKINLNDDDKIRLIDALNNGVEPSPDLLPKLFPGTAEKFDVAKLDRAKVPTLEYAGKRSKAAILAEAGAGSGPLEVERCFGCKAPKTDDDYKEWRNILVQGDNLQFLKACYKNEDPLIKDKVKGKVDLIYIDPPFATKSDFGGKDGERSYADKLDQAEFLESLKERLCLLRGILSNKGTIYIHLDQKMSHYVKIVMDEVFGKDKFINEIVWSYTSGGAGIKSFAKKHDSILVFSKTSDYKFNQQKIKRIVDKSKGYDPRIEYFKDSETGKEYRLNLMTDVWSDIGIISPNGFERVNYPTQKPEDLIKRIIESSSNTGDLILDCFGGSGTTAAAAEKLGRRWISCDFGKHAIYTQQRRMLRIGESKALKDELDDEGKVIIKKGDVYGHDPKPFYVASVGAYDFSHVMSLRDHKDRYIDFVLGLFQLSRDKKSSQSYKLVNIFAEKEKSPVEVYPVWQDPYLKDIKIDEDYLQSIVDQVGSRLTGDYYIIAPETCSNVSETTLKNGSGHVTFHILSFPYKVLEDASRHFQLHEQPSSQDEVNQLITSTAFYFNEDIEIAITRNSDGFEITEFKTSILNKESEPFPELSGIAMILVDQYYEQGKPFDMDDTVFAKDIKDGKVKIALTKSVAVIAIDKHGNESKPIKI
jgi:DNA modification methylase